MTEVNEISRDISMLNNKIVCLITKKSITWYEIIKAFNAKHIYLKELETIQFKNTTFCTCKHANTTKYIKITIQTLMYKYVPIVSENDLFFVN